MTKRDISMRAGNKGLTVKVNLWALDKYKEDFDAEMGPRPGASGDDVKGKMKAKPKTDQPELAL